MNKNYASLAESVRARLNPDNIILNKSFRDELSSISYNDVLLFVRMAMKGVEPEYTQKSIEAGERVKEHLSKELKEVAYKYQGSVMTDTHIKGYSDIDLLVISQKFYSWDPFNTHRILNNPEERKQYYESSIKKLQNEVDNTSYSGNPESDLRSIRLDSEEVLTSTYSVCDILQPKAIKIKNLNLYRDVDIVVAGWYDDVSSIINDKGDYRGIQIYNKESNSREKADFPFLSIKRINERSSFTMGRLKKMIRFLKNIKALSEHDIQINSFDINAICYDIDHSTYKNLAYYDLVPVLYKQIKSICSNPEHANNVISVDGREYIFRYNSPKLENLKLVLREIESIHFDLQKKPIYV